MHTLHTCFCTFDADLYAQSVLSNKISLSEFSRKFIKSALLVGLPPLQGRLIQYSNYLFLESTSSFSIQSTDATNNCPLPISPRFFQKTVSVFLDRRANYVQFFSRPTFSSSDLLLLLLFAGKKGNADPTNNALLINFLLSSDADLLLISTY